MKKIMITVVAIALTTAVQAASVAWGSGQVYGPSDDKGTIGSGTAYRLSNNPNVSWYIFAGLTEDQYKAAQTAGTVYGWLTAEDAPSKSVPESQGTLANGTLSGVTTTGYSALENVYAAILITYKDANGKDWYLENTALVSIDGMGSDASKGNLARYIDGDNTKGAINGGVWTAASVPEPTSGLLLLLGVAGLALKRRRA